MSDDKNLKSGWKIWRFDQMATNVNARIDNPSESGMEHYVGLEHLDSDSLKIRRWGTPDDVEATKLTFKKGDIIFGRRRAYQRKLGVAEFDGICSAHAMVLRAKPDVVLPKFLPFFMQSDLFMRRAVDISVGSLSPTINWKTMAAQEFALPPLSEQGRLTELLSAHAELCERLREAESLAERARRAALLDAFRPDRGASDRFPSHWSIKRTQEVGDVQLGQQRHPKYESGTNIRPYLRVANVLDGWIDFRDLNEMHFPQADLSKFELQAGDVLLNEGQSFDLVGRSAVYRGEVPGICCQKTLIRFRCGESLLPDFAQAFFQHCLYTGQFAAMCVQTTSMAHLTAVRFAAMLMPVPPLEEQAKIASVVKATASAAEALRRRMAGTVALSLVSELVQ